MAKTPYVVILSVFFLLLAVAPARALAQGAEGVSALEQELIAMREQMALMQREITRMQAKIEELEARPERPGPPAPDVSTPLPGMGKPAFELPDISVIGNVIGNYGTDRSDPDRNKIFLNELELALQGYLYPDIWANFILALERESDGDYEVDIEEGYVEFMSIPALPGLSSQVGKKLIAFGKVNPVHAHHWNYVDRPRVLESYLGDEGLAGQGANFSYLLPLPFFSQVDLGIWYVDAEDPHDDDILGLAKETYSTRFWSSFPLSRAQELEIGVSGVMGSGGHYDEHRDKVQIGGLDLTYRFLGERLQRFLYQGEILLLRREIPDDTLYRWGLYQFVNYRFNKNWDAGVRFDWFETPSAERHDHYSFSGILTRALTETTKLRLQYTYEPREDDHTVYLQGIFGLGPHAHALE